MKTIRQALESMFAHKVKWWDSMESETSTASKGINNSKLKQQCQKSLEIDSNYKTYQDGGKSVSSLHNMFGC